MEAHINLKQQTPNILDINKLLSYKNNPELQNLEAEILEKLNELFGGDKIRKNKKNIKKQQTPILKNQKIQNKKDNIGNRVNLILNKLSESNIDSLIMEFVENINQVDEETFEEVQKTIYLKILSEINFVKVYLQFIKILSFVYMKVQSFNISYFYSLVEAKFLLDYTEWDIEPNSKYEFIRNLEGETKRINNLILIKNMVENRMLSESVYLVCDNQILNQSVFLPDIFYWFNSKNRELNDQEKDLVRNLLKKNGIGQREIVLLESILNRKISKMVQSSEIKSELNQPNQTPKPVSKESERMKTDTLKIECENIIEEYLLIKSIDEVSYFIENRCPDAISKNRFCESLIDKYFGLSKEKANEMIELMKVLTKNQTLFKSNLSRGLLLIYGNWKERSLDYSKPLEKMKLILSTLKNWGITKGIEYLLEHYKI
jgi:hypothetical protein